jgi:hypothetical protein
MVLEAVRIGPKGWVGYVVLAETWRAILTIAPLGLHMGYGQTKIVSRTRGIALPARLCADSMRLPLDLPRNTSHPLRIPIEIEILIQWSTEFTQRSAAEFW